MLLNSTSSRFGQLTIFFDASASSISNLQRVQIQRIFFLVSMFVEVHTMRTPSEISYRVYTKHDELFYRTNCSLTLGAINSLYQRKKEVFISLVSFCAEVSGLAIKKVSIFISYNLFYNNFLIVIFENIACHGKEHVDCKNKRRQFWTSVI